MKITINQTSLEVTEKETIIQAAKRMGIAIPSLCYAEGAVHKSSCMVCAVRNAANGQIIPSCTTLVTEGMEIDTESDEVKNVRRLSLELLLSDHRADCEAPCSTACKKGLDVEYFLARYDAGQDEAAYQVIHAAFTGEELGCADCKAPCEKICRRGTVDKAVEIRKLIQEIADKFGYPKAPQAATAKCEQEAKNSSITEYRSLLGRFSDTEKERLKATVDAPSRCLHCACNGRNGCKLRQYASEEGIKRSRYGASSQLPVMTRQLIKSNLWFESAKCIRCGICVYNSKNGFTFKDRGFGMEVMVPEASYANVEERLATLCPTGAIYLKRE